MGLNDINLPAALIAGFYKNHLIESNLPAAPIKIAAGTASTKKTIQYLGKNQKGVCLLVDYANDVYLPDNELSFLSAILQACKLNLGDVAIINFHQHKISFKELREQISCKYLLVFGIDAVNIGLAEIPLFTAGTTQDCNIVYSVAAEQLNNKHPESKLLKSKLWICLKQLFNV